MSHEEEQALEIEALTSIFEEGREFFRVSDTEFSLKLLPFPAGEEENHVGVSLHVKFTEDYPDGPPEWDLRDVKGLNDPKMEELKGTIEEAINSSLGMAMIYNVAEACQDWLKTNNKKELSMHEEMLLRMAGEEGEGDEEDEEDDDDYDDDDDGKDMEDEWKGLAEKTLCAAEDRITPEAFLKWKVGFDQEMIAAGLLKREENKAKTGKQIFMEAEQKVKEEGKDSEGKDAPLVYDAALFGEEGVEDDDLDDLSGGED